MGRSTVENEEKLKQVFREILHIENSRVLVKHSWGMEIGFREQACGLGSGFETIGLFVDGLS
jgi:hypothetical protein